MHLYFHGGLFLSGLAAATSISELAVPINDVDYLVQVNEDWEDVPESASSAALAETQAAPLSTDVVPQASANISDNVLAQAETEWGRGGKAKKMAAARARAAAENRARAAANAARQRAAAAR